MSPPAPPPSPPSQLTVAGSTEVAAITNSLANTAKLGLAFGQRKWWCQLNAYAENCDAELMLGRLASVLVPSDSSNPHLLSWLWPHSPNNGTALLSTSLPKHPSICYVHVNKAGGAALTVGLWGLQRQGVVSRVAEMHGVSPTKAADSSWKPDLAHLDRYFPPGPLRMDSCLGYTIVLWVRDPINRIISSINFLRPSKTRGENEARMWTSLANHVQRRVGLNAENVTTADLLQTLHAANVLCEVIAQTGHAQNPLAKYLLGSESKPLLSAAGRIRFVGRLEAYDTDWDKLLRHLGVSQKAIGSTGRRLTAPHNHQTPRDGAPLSKAVVLALRSSVAMSYACIWALEQVNLIPAGYHQNLTSGVHYLSR